MADQSLLISDMVFICSYCNGFDRGMCYASQAPSHPRLPSLPYSPLKMSAMRKLYGERSYRTPGSCPRDCGDAYDGFLEIMIAEYLFALGFSFLCTWPKLTR